MTVNYLAVLVGAVLSMVVGAIWYGPLFGKKWLEIVGASEVDLETRRQMQKSAGPLYVVQFFLTLFQVLVLAILVNNANAFSGISVSFLVWAAFIMPTVAGCAMWTSEPSKQKWARFLIQAGYQLVLFIIFGLLLQLWK
ncbi:DUF1761 domain-containing protein [Candidatus Nomurabacteria bacterium]|nr:DUF1761 domain-containing protein [Candidatus Nomurabacteria bacterium]